jgi:alpha-amylase/alpha-mannosidase (GH57 family)
MGKRYICIHGHFYQPPRENAWLETIEAQDSAHPYHDWNDRINAECYAANAASRILDAHRYIVAIVNNYIKMSFNFGPTLLSWMEGSVSSVYQDILDADKASVARFGGHGSALAQACNHMIMPLANRRDKETQIRWGIRDFEHRFGRHPEGMWLPETAVDTETLDLMAQFKIAFTILSPSQAAEVRPKGADTWQDVSDGSIDTTRAYRVNLPSGKSICVFFYHGELSRAVAFQQLPADGDHFFHRLTEGFRQDTDAAQLVHVASDGETYGHHQHRGDMGLAYALHLIEQNEHYDLTNYGEFLERHPPTDEVRIKENTSWSCVHGVDRWRRDCGCHSGGNPQWRQAWRQPLREALDWLRDTLVAQYEVEASRYLKNPWKARNEYIDVVLHRDTDTIERFFRRNSNGSLSAADRVTVLKLMELQRNAMLMYTSCGWFFDELSGIETVQVIQYAGRVLQLAGALFQVDLETSFLEKLAAAPSNIPEHGDGRRLYEKWVRHAAVSLADVGAHFAISSLFKNYQEKNPLYSYTAIRRSYQRWEAGRAKLALGRVGITSQVTWESSEFDFAVLHFGDHNISCGLDVNRDAKTTHAIQQDVTTAFEQADFPAVVQKLDKHFSGHLYSMKSLFRDEQRRILEPILETRVVDAMAVYRAVYVPNVPLMRFLKDTNSLIPKALATAGELVLNYTLKLELAKERLDHDQIRDLMEQARLASIPLDKATLEYTLRKNIEGQNARFEEDPTRFDMLDELTAAVELVYAMPFDVILRVVQNTHFKVGRRIRNDFVLRAKRGEEDALRWLERFDQLSEKLLIRLRG